MASGATNMIIQTASNQLHTQERLNNVERIVHLTAADIKKSGHRKRHVFFRDSCTTLSKLFSPGDSSDEKIRSARRKSYHGRGKGCTGRRSPLPYNGLRETARK